VAEDIKLQRVHEMSAQYEGHTCPLDFTFHSGTNERVLMKFYAQDLHQKLLGGFNFGSCRSNMTSILHVAHIRLH
jgi:hypothetical protein